MRDIGADVRFADVFVLRRAAFGATIARLAILPLYIWRASRRMARYQLTYINTVVLLDFLLASRFGRGRRLIHIHELPTGTTRSVLARVLRWSRGRFVFNSHAACDNFAELSDRPGEVTWNGTRAFAIPPPAARRGPLKLLLIGRFNAWKGQELLLAALAALPIEQREGLRVRLVGSAFDGQEHFVSEIERKIAALGLGGVVERYGFDAMPDSHYRWADVVVVPSTRPEPFGLVAIEAMSASRAVIAADHGGLAEIVLDRETGLRVVPCDAPALAAAIATYLDDPTLVIAHGAAGRERYESEFREETYMTRLADAVAATMSEVPARRPVRASRVSV